jgi:hypothetical protein
MALTFQQVVQEVQQQRLGELLSEDAFEPDVGKRIDKLSHVAKLSNLSETAKEITNFSAEITFKRHKACFLPCAALHCLTRCSATSPPPFCH